ncbi:TIGR03960 family B12-binding radical SAM protein [Desulfosarcina sp. OttesenSCG-928-A07]|nr:TIGR03960 family B12-binding radical SAM protein [Desulfosarcina sp. OttesenSCG-928-A07]
MADSAFESILPFVQLPGRYLGNEFNRIQKNWDQTLFHVALAFPDLYEIATSHFGIPILYEILNREPDILAERVFAPAPDMEARLRENRILLPTLESAMPLNQFDVVGFSLLYELNYTNMLNMLDLGGIALLSKDRRAGDPFVIAGGPCTCNPEPIADFFDAVVIGDGEAVMLALAASWKKWKTAGDGQRETLLEAWSHIGGVYVPSFFDASDEGKTGVRRPVPRKSWHQVIRRAVVPDLNTAPCPTSPIIPHGKPVHDRLRVEIARGCTRGCRFCQAGMIYRPVRERAPENILSLAETALKQTGYEDLSLLSLSTGDYSCISPLMRHFMDYGEKAKVAVSLPSLRAGSLTPELMDLIQRVRKTGFTIAPEAGSQRLRDVINKNISESDIVETVRNVSAMGWKVIKLYFMIGLPTETQDDLNALVDLVRRLKINDKISLHVSFSTFVPKPHTPFQWEPQIDLETAWATFHWLKGQLQSRRIHVKWQDPRASKVEAIWARGDRRLGPVLINAFKAGCRFDGWSEFFNYKRWLDVFEKSGIQPLNRTERPWDLHGVLPWDHIDTGVSKHYLSAERDRAMGGVLTPDCRLGTCSGCGVCDFETLNPIVFQDHSMTVSPLEVPASDKTENGPFFTYAMNFQKKGRLRFVGHLELIRMFVRAFRRAGLPLKYSGGFHPMPRISFGDTLPMGMQSENEVMWVTLTRFIEPDTLLERLSAALKGSGIPLMGCWLTDRGDKQKNPDIRAYRVTLKDGTFDPEKVNAFDAQPSVIIEKKNKKGKIGTLDLKKVVKTLELHDNMQALMAIETEENKVIRPAQVLKTVFDLTDEQIMAALITKVE